MVKYEAGMLPKTKVQKEAEREEKVAAVIRVGLPWAKPFICTGISGAFLSRSS